MESNRNSGLSSQDAALRLQRFGRNEIGSSAAKSKLAELAKVLTDPMGLMMLGLALLYFLLGDKSDAIIILIAYIPITAIDVILELQAEKALKALKSTLEKTAKVYRDGVLVTVPVAEVVPGDLVAFEEGQALPADGEVFECQELAVNEASLTGESLPVEKKLKDEFFAGTSVFSGRGLGLVTLTGHSTKFGKITQLIEETRAELTPLQKKVNVLVKRIVIVAALLVALLFVIELTRHKGTLQSLVTALTLGMAAVPEEFPLVFTLYLSLGAWRLSKRGVLIKSLPCVESLGNVDVICTDKTGTLTEGKFSLVEVVSFGEVSDSLRTQATLLACEPVVVDAMEVAIYEKLGAAKNMLDGWNLKFDYPFEKTGKHMAHAWSRGGSEGIVAMKGAVEGVLEHCDISTSQRESVLSKVAELSSQGKRLLGLAVKTGTIFGDRTLDEAGLQFIGLLVFRDPVRPSAKEAVKGCQDAGIELKMLTGDHPLTAHAVADELELKHSHDFIYSGSQLSKMSEAEKSLAFQVGSIFARVTPEQKFEMVQSLKKIGRSVAMTGDGINDAPALKLADVGISMGMNATDAARSTAKMILMKNDFSGIVAAVLEGRNVFANLRRSFSYLISFHIPVILLALIPPLLGKGDFLLPVHIILLELIVHPISAFAFENMKSLSHQKKGELVTGKLALTSALSGILLTAASLAPLWLFETGHSLNFARTVGLSIVIYGNLGFMFAEVLPETTKRLWVIAVILLLLPAILTGMEFPMTLLHVENIQVKWHFVALAAGLFASVPAFVIRLLKS